MSLSHFIQNIRKPWLVGRVQDLLVDNLLTVKTIVADSITANILIINSEVVNLSVDNLTVNLTLSLPPNSVINNYIDSVSTDKLFGTIENNIDSSFVDTEDLTVLFNLSLPTNSVVDDFINSVSSNKLVGNVINDVDNTNVDTDNLIVHDSLSIPNNSINDINIVSLASGKLVGDIVNNVNNSEVDTGNLTVDTSVSLPAGSIVDSFIDSVSGSKITGTINNDIFNENVETDNLIVNLTLDFPTNSILDTFINSVSTSKLTGTLQAAQFPALTGDVTTSSGSLATTISNNAVSLAKITQIATASFLGRNTAGTGNVEILSTSTAKTMLNLSGTNSGDVSLSGENYLSLAGQVISVNPVSLSGTNVTGTLAAARFPALSGDVTNTAGSLSTTISNNAVSLAKMAQMATASFLGRNTAGTGNPEVLSTSTAKTMLNLSGTNSGDVSLSGENYLSLAGQVITANPINLATSNITGILPNANTTGTASSTANSLVLRDSSNNFSANTITASLNGNATSSTTSTTATNANNIATTSTTSSATYYPIFVSSSSNSNQVPRLNSSFYVNPQGNLSFTSGGANCGLFLGSAASMGCQINRASSSTDWAYTMYSTGNVPIWSQGLHDTTNNNYVIYDEVNANFPFRIVAGATPITTLTGNVNMGGTINLAALSASGLVATDGSKNLTSTVSSLSPTFVGLNLSGLTASRAVVTDSSNNLASLQYTSSNVNSSLVFRDSSGNFSASNITGALVGNASTSSSLLNSRTIGGVSFNGTANIVPQTIESANENTDTTCFPLFITSSGTQQLQPKNNTGFTYNSSTNNLGCTTFTGALSGNATTATNATNATTLATSRNINGTGFDGSANITVPVNTTTTTTQTGYLTFVPANTSSNQSAYVNSAIQYNPNTTTMTVDNIVGTYSITSLQGLIGASATVSGDYIQNGYTCYGCKAFCTFNGTSASPITPSVSGNIASITKPAATTGIYKITFTNALPSANYSVQVTASRNGKPTAGRSDCACGVLVDDSPTYTGRTTTYCHIFTSFGASSYYNDQDINVCIYF